MRKRVLFFVVFLLQFLLLFPEALYAQTRQISLNDAIEIALEQSPSAMSAKHRFRRSYWAYRSFRAGYLPQLKFDATIPSFNRSIQSIQQNDGTFIFRPSNNAHSNLALSLNQKIGFTGGEVFISSSLQRLDLFESGKTITSFLSTPVSIGIRQPIFGFNEYRWSKNIEPLKYKEAKQQYLEAMEQVRIEAVFFFFEVLTAQMRYYIDVANAKNNDTLCKIAQGRFNIGTIAENELLQLELKLLLSQAASEESLLDYQNKRFKFFSFLRISEESEAELIVPELVSLHIDDMDKAVAEAHKNRSVSLAFQRRIIEADMEVNKANRNRYSANIYASYGLSQSSKKFDQVYKDPNSSQQLAVGLSIPILDWGEAKGKIRMAESNRELVLGNIEQERIDFSQQVRHQVAHFNMQENQLRIAGKSDTIAQKRYEVTKQRYLIGKINVTELNIAQEEKDNARLGYVKALSNYWRNYYQLRKETLYDYFENRELDVNEEKLLK